MKGVMMSYTIQKTKLVDSLNEEREYIENAHEKDMLSLNQTMAHSKHDFDKAEHDARVNLFVSEEIHRNQVTHIHTI
jgi:hypothetical protein